MNMNVKIIGKYAVMVIGYDGDISFISRINLDSLNIGDQIKDLSGDHVGTVKEKTETKIVIVNQ